MAVRNGVKPYLLSGSSINDDECSIMLYKFPFRAIDYSPWGHGGSKNKILAQKIHVLPVSEIFGRAMPTLQPPMLSIGLPIFLNDRCKNCDLENEKKYDYFILILIYLQT